MYRILSGLILIFSLFAFLAQTATTRLSAAQYQSTDTRYTLSLSGVAHPAPIAPRAETPTTEPPTATATLVPTEPPTTTEPPTITPEPPTATATEVATTAPTEPATPTIIVTEAPTAAPTPTLPPPTIVPPTGANLATFANWQSASAATDVQMAPPDASHPKALYQLEIPAIDLVAPVAERGWRPVSYVNGVVRNQWEEVRYAAGWHKNSAHPGRTGNIVISGHNNVYGAVFRDLWQLKPGNRVYLDQGQVRYTYQVEKVAIEQELGATPQQQAHNAAYLNQTDDNRLTLITCWPWNDTTHRVFVVARLTSITTNIH